jgi:hypothetical protein
MGNTRITIAGGGIAVAPVAREIKKFVPRATRKFGDWLREQQR